MSDDQYTKLFKYIDERLGKTEASVSADVASIRDEVRTGFDQMAARLDDDYTERMALNAQVDRHEGWIQQLGEKTNIDLAVET